MITQNVADEGRLCDIHEGNWPASQSIPEATLAHMRSGRQLQTLESLDKDSTDPIQIGDKVSTAHFILVKTFTMTLGLN